MTTNAAKGAAKSLDTARHAKGAWTVSYEIKHFDNNELMTAEIHGAIERCLG